VLLAAFGTFWVGEGIGLAWPGGDWSILALIAGFLLIALLLTRHLAPLDAELKSQGLLPSEEHSVDK
jgi:uncharacterized membrane protein